MRTVALSTILERVRRRTDTQSETARFDDASVIDDINEGVAWFHRQVVAARGPGQLRSTVSISTVDGTATYELPAYFLEVMAVYTTIDGVRRTFDRFNDNDVDGTLSTGLSWAGSAGLFYNLQGANIAFLPAPDAIHTVTLDYCPTAVQLITPTDTLDGIDGLEEAAVCWASKQIARKQRDFELVQGFNDDLDRLAAEIKSFVGQRDAFKPAQMVDLNPRRSRLGTRRRFW